MTSKGTWLSKPEQSTRLPILVVLKETGFLKIENFDKNNFSI